MTPDNSTVSACLLHVLDRVEQVLSLDCTLQVAELSTNTCRIRRMLRKDQSYSANKAMNKPQLAHHQVSVTRR